MASVAMEAMIVIRNLVKRFGTIVAVNHLNMDVYRGEIYALLGPNGAGKTTTVRMLMGLIKPSSGEIYLDGIDVVRKPHLVKKRVGYVPQFFSLYSDLTVVENLDFLGRIYGMTHEERRRRINELLKTVELTRHRDVLAGNLSGGLKRRLGLAAALIHDPKLLILDEPTAGVDPPLRRAFWRLFKDLKEAGKTILVTTHYMDEAEHADRIGLISAGKLRAVGTPREIKRMVHGGDLMRIVLRGIKRTDNNFLHLDHVMKILERRLLDDSKLEIIVVVRDFGSALPDITAHFSQKNVDVLLIEPVPITLEDAFIALTTGDSNV